MPALAFAVGLLALAWYALFVWRTRFTIGGKTYFSLFDDEMISLRYAWNLVHGHGLAWNATGPHVEGYTNLLWTLWMAVVEATGIPDRLAALAVVVSEIVLLLANLALIWRLTRRLVPNSPLYAVASVALVAAYYPLVFWALRGTEVGLITLLFSAAALLAFTLDERFDRRMLVALCAVCSLGLLTRTDFVVPAAIVIMYLALRARSRRIVISGALTASILATFVGQTLFRLWYYHSALPNTYYLKLEGIALTTRISRGLASIAQIELVELYLLTALVVAAIVLARGVLRARLCLLVALSLGQVAYSIYVGGDAWEWMQITNRYLTPGAVVAIVAAVVGVEHIVRTGRRVQALFGLAGFCLLVGLLNLPAFGYVRQLGLTADLLSRIRAVTPLALVGLLLVATFAWRKRTSFAGVAGVALFIALFLSADAQPLQSWVRHNAFQVELEASYAHYGVALARTTTPSCSIGVVLAGIVPYFSHRPAVDLLGKNDRHVARSAPHPGQFVPGHDKWDYPYSIGQLRPDLVAQLYSPTAADETNMTLWGYQKIGGSYVLRKASCIDRRRLDPFLAGGPLPPA